MRSGEPAYLQMTSVQSAKSFYVEFTGLILSMSENGDVVRLTISRLAALKTLEFICCFFTENGVSFKGKG
jgi:hypothetical protein